LLTMLDRTSSPPAGTFALRKKVGPVPRKPVRDRRVRAELTSLANAHPARWARVCAAVAHFEGWDCAGDREAEVAMLRRRLSTRQTKAGARHFDGDWLFIVLDEFPESELAGMFIRHAAKVQAKRELSETG
jgi:hypothetical protein